MPRMSPAQRAYAKAKAAHETAMTFYKARCKAELPQYTEAEFDAMDADALKVYVDADAIIYRECGLREFSHLLREAEDNLIAWGYEVVKRSPMYHGNRENLDYLFRGQHGLLRVHEQLVDLSFRLKGSTAPA